MNKIKWSTKSDGMNDGHREQYYEVTDQRFLGAEGFGEKLQDEHEEARPKKRRPLDKAVQELSQLLAVQPQVLRSADRSWGVSLARAKIGYFLVRRQGCALGEVARYFARDVDRQIERAHGTG